MGTIRQVGDSAVTLADNVPGWGAYPSYLKNLPGGVYDLQGDGSVLSEGHSNVQNEGTFRKSGGTGESVIEAGFHNSGLLEVGSGVLALNGGGEFRNGSTSVADGAELRVGTIGLLMYGDNTFTGPGSVNSVENGGLCVFGGYGGPGASATIHGDAPFLVNGGRLSADQPLDSLLFAPDTDIRFLSGWVGGHGTVTVAGSFDWQGGTLAGSLVNTGGDFRILGSGEKKIDGNYSASLSNSGAVRQIGESVVTMDSIVEGWGSVPPTYIRNLSGGIFDLQGDGDILSDGTNHVENEGTFRKSAGAGESVIEPSFTNAGTVEVASGTLAFNGGFTQTAGLTSLNGGSISSTSPVDIQGGMIAGGGTIWGDVHNMAGVLSPGFSPGVITIDGDYIQGPDAKLLIEIGGWLPGQYDVLNVTGTAYLDGPLQISVLDGFFPTTDYTFDFLHFGSHIGSFDEIIGWDLGWGNYFSLAQGPSGFALDFHYTNQAVPVPSAVVLAALGLLTATRFLRSDSGKS